MGKHEQHNNSKSHVKLRLEAPPHKSLEFGKNQIEQCLKNHTKEIGPIIQPEMLLRNKKVAVEIRQLHHCVRNLRNCCLQKVGSSQLTALRFMLSPFAIVNPYQHVFFIKAQNQSLITYKML